MCIEIQSLSRDNQGLLNTTSYTQWTFSVKKPMTYFCSLCFPIFLYSVYTLISHFLPSSLCHWSDSSILSEWHSLHSNFVNFTQDSRFQIRNALNLFQSIITFLPPSPSSSPLDPNLISEHLFQGNNSCQWGQSSLQTPTLYSVEIDIVFGYMFTFNTILHGSNMFLCVLALIALLLTLANIEM